MKDNMSVVGVGIDHIGKEIRFLTNFTYKKARDYIMVSKKIAEKLGDKVKDYTVVFNNKKFKDIIDMAQSCSDSYSKEVDKLLNPKLNQKRLKELGIISIDFKERFIEFDTKIEKPSALGIMCTIPTLLPLSIKYGDRVYRNIASLAKDALKGYSESDIINLTNEFVKDTLETVRIRRTIND